MTFLYTVSMLELDLDGLEMNSPLVLEAGQSIVDGVGNAAALTFTPPVLTGVRVDGYLPMVNQVAPPADAVYGLDQPVDFTLYLNKNVQVDLTGGTPYIPVTVGSRSARASYYSGSGSSELVFRYTVAAGDADADGVEIGCNTGASFACWDLDGGSIRDAFGNEASDLLGFAQSYSEVKVDAVAPSITKVEPPAAGTYKADDTLAFTVKFSEVVQVTGSPYIAVTIGDETKQAVYVSGSNSTELVFRYVLQSGDVDANGIAVAGGLTAGSGVSIEDAAGNAATLTFTSPTTSGIMVDAVAPSITKVVPPAAGTYETGDTLVFTAKFSEVVRVKGSPYIAVTIGSTTRQVAYASGDGSTELEFRYVLVAGDADANGISAASSVVANGGSITDDAGHAAVLAFGALTTTAILVKNIPPTNVATTPGFTGYSLAYESSTGVFHMQVPYAARHAEIVLLDAAGHRMASKSLGSVAGNMDVSFAHVPASWSLAVLRIDGAVRATWRGGYSSR